jgi:hypothetical protein
MDELPCPSSSCRHHSPVSFSFTGGHHPVVLEFESCGVPEQWLEDDGEGLQQGDDDDDAVWCDGGSLPLVGKHPSDNPPAPPAPTIRRRDRKLGPRTNVPVISHVEVERQRRDKLTAGSASFGPPCPRVNIR